MLQTPETTIRFTSYPLTAPPPHFVDPLMTVFRRHERAVSTTDLRKGLTSNEVLGVLAEDLLALGFRVETGNLKSDRIERPVYYGENGRPTLQYHVDAYHPAWRCGLEVEAGRALMGNAIYRDLVQALVMVEVEHLILAVPNTYKYATRGRHVVSEDYKKTNEVARAVFGHGRVAMPYALTVVGY